MKPPRFIRYVIFLIAVLLFACFSPPAPATEYTGSFVEWSQPGTVTGFCPVVDTGSVTSASLFINNASTSRGFENNNMVLISPDGTGIYLFDLPFYPISGASLFHTWFIDTAPIIITDGIPPYVGSFRPGESFSNFNGEWMTGTWTLAVYNDANGNYGAVTDWTLIINQATPVPTPSPVNPTPTPILITYREYPGSAISWSAITSSTGTIGIGNHGTVYDVNVNLSAYASGGLDPIGIYLQSPEGDFVALFNKHDLAEYSLYLTTFDDAAGQSIKSGVAPYIGLYRPVDSLALFNNQSLYGDWSLIVYSDSADAGEVTDWSLIIGAKDYDPSPIPTPTVTPTPTVSPTPSIPPTPSPTVSPYAHCPIYQGTPFIIDNPSVKSRIITLDDIHKIGKIMVNIEDFYVEVDNDLDNIGIYLISPQEKVVALFEKHQLAEHALAGTWFDDDSSTNIVDGLGPYVGHFHPTGNLSDLYGEPIAGDWQLLVFNDSKEFLANAYMNDWSIEICAAVPTLTPPPQTPSPTITPVSQCWEYSGESISWTGVTAATSGIYVDHSGIVTKVELRVSTECSDSLADMGIYLVNPAGLDVALFQVDDLSGHIMYRTYYDDDSSNRIKDGSSPFLGIYHPVEDLADFIGQESGGIWNLLVYNNLITNKGNISDIELHICIEGAVPVLTPTQTPTPIPTPTPLPTPVGECPAESGDAYTALGQQVKWCPIPAPTTSGRVAKVTLYIDEFHITEEGDLDFVGMWLVSPGGKVVELFPKHVLEEHSLSATWFNDSATKEITEGLGPYIGEWRPTGLLSDFNGDDIAGEWNLVIFNDFVCDQWWVPPPYCEDWAKLEEKWVLEICPMPPSPTPTLTPPGPTRTPPPVVPTPNPVCSTTSGGSFTESGVGTFPDIINISDNGLVVDVKVELTLTCSVDLDSVGIYLRSPSDIDVALFEKHELDEHALYQTIFTDESQYPIISKDSVSPYLGSFRPTSWGRDVNDNCTGGFCEFNGDSVKGDWTLLVYNDTSGNTINLEDWKLTICKFPSPTPSPVTTPPPTPTIIPPPPTPVYIFQSGDYDGDGTSDIGVFRPATGLWSVRSVGTSFFGQQGDIPASGDYASAGTTDLAIYRGTTGLWAVYGVTRVYFGGSSDTSAPGDYDGDGLCDIGIYRSSSGLWAIRGVTRFYFGGSSDYPIPRDYDGDGLRDFAVFRPSTSLWAVNGVTRVYFGASGDLPVPRDYDGDGSDDMGVVRFSSGLWVLRGISRFYFGGTGDYPVPADYLGSGIVYPAIFRCGSSLWAIRGVTRVYAGACGDIPVAW
jgi:subtilisin-like proprotein convertase family protein